MRASRNLTQAEFAEDVGVSLRYLQSVEGGEENLTVSSLASLAKALDVGIADLFVLPTTPRPRRGRPKKKRS